MDTGSGGGIDIADQAGRLITRLTEVSEQVAVLAFDGFADGDLEQLLDGLRVPLARLEAARARGLADLERRASRRAPSGGATAAELEQRRRNAARQRLAPSAAKRAAEAGRAAADHVATGEAFRSGELDSEHVRVIGGLLRRVPLGEREELEQQFVALARELDPVAFGRRARDLLARQAPAAAKRVEQLADNRHAVRATDTPDGGFAFSGLLYGTAAETARVALAAFRRPDTPDEHRGPEQRTADAFEQLCTSALRAGDAPTVHGVRPQVIVVIEESDVDRPDGVARFAHSGQPVTAGSLGHLLGDATVARLVRDAAGAPLEASAGVRTVPAGLWKALLVRDGGCTWLGCDAPANWCDVAHGEQAHRHDGRLSPDNAALLCRRHHRRYDHGPFRMIIEGDQVSYERRSVAPAVFPGSEAAITQEPVAVSQLAAGPDTARRRRRIAATSAPAGGSPGDRTPRRPVARGRPGGPRAAASDIPPATLFDVAPARFDDRLPAASAGGDPSTGHRGPP